MHFVSNYMLNADMRHMLNELAQKTFGISFEKWVTDQYFRGDYLPYSYIEDGKMLSNVSVNRMEFLQNGVKRNYIQIGTVMTEESHRKQGLAAKLMQDVIQQYASGCDGIYLFATVNLNNIVIGGIAFGINSGAYVAEIFRSGIMSVDKGQTEAGRSLGLNPAQTMRLIIIPQAFKNVLPALINEMIVLLKETAIIGYIGTIDITKAATLVQSRTYDALVPLLSAAIFYLILVMILTYFMGKLERRLRKSDH